MERSSFLLFSAVLTRFCFVSVASKCSHECTDFHRLCPAIQSPEFYNYYKQGVESGEFPDLPEKVLPQPACSQKQFLVLCPASCEQCTPCSKKNARDIKTLEKLIEEMQKEIDALELVEDETPAKIPVLGMYGDPAWHGHKETTIDKAFEGSPSTNYKNCYVSNNNKNDKAEIYIPRSKVVQIKLLNRADCCTNRIADIGVSVCDPGNGCSACGKFKGVGAGEWATLECRGKGAIGTTVKLTNQNEHLQFCEMEILGTVMKPVELQPIKVSGMLADPAWHGHKETTIDKAFQGNDDLDYRNCYVANPPAGGQARIDIEPASVIQVHFLNRKDCCTDRIASIEVQVCEKGGACTPCGNPYAVPGGEWSVAYCKGGFVKGNQIHLRNPSTHLQFCEMKILGTVLSPNTFQELGEIQVVGMFADPAWHGHPETTIDKAFQKMSDDYNYKQCYVSNTNRLARANIDIEPAVVHQVIILNRGDCCENRLASISIEVCVKGDSCKKCGNPHVAAKGAWSWVTCGRPIKGNEIQLINAADHLQFCELGIIGQALKTAGFESIVPIKVTGTFADPAWHGHRETTIDKAFEGSDSWHYKQCYVSNPPTNGKASIDIEPAKVSQIKILNRGDCCTDRLASIDIYVCIKGKSCKKCGNPEAVGGTQWSIINCQGRFIQGNEIQLKNPKTHLQFCEMVIYGIPLKNANFPVFGLIPVTGMSGTRSWHGHQQTTIDKAFDGSDEWNFPKCYVANPNKDGQASIDIKPAAVSEIRILNRGDCCTDRLASIKIEVCVKGGACKYCGNPEAVHAATWAWLKCNGGAINGNEIKLTNPSTYLQFCELQILGRELKNPTLGNIVPIKVTGMTATPAWHGHPTTTIDQAFEGSQDWNYLKCYVANPNRGGEATLDIPKSAVKQIRLLNRGDCCENRMGTIQIEVCMKGGRCKSCGSPPHVPGGSWAWLDCGNGKVGNQIKVKNPVDHLQFCEMEIFGIPK